MFYINVGIGWLCTRLVFTGAPSTVTTQALHFVKCLVEHCHLVLQPITVSLQKRQPPASTIKVPLFVRFSITESIIHFCYKLNAHIHKLTTFCPMWVRQKSATILFRSCLWSHTLVLSTTHLDLSEKHTNTIVWFKHFELSMVSIFGIFVNY